MLVSCFFQQYLGVVVIVDVQLPMESVSITTNVVRIPLMVKCTRTTLCDTNFGSDLRQIGGLLHQ
jgi:hypothetical protein